MLVDEACFERGCACHDSRESPGVEVMRKEWQELSEEEIQTYRYMIDWTAEWSYIKFARAIEAAVKDKNA